MKYACTFLSIIMSLCFSAHAQTNSSVGQFTPERVTTCEYLKHALDFSLIDSRGDDAAYVNLVFRPGKKEKSTRYSQGRVGFILKYLKFRDKTFDRIKISSKDAITDLGKLEIFVKGLLRWEIYFRKNTTRWNSCIE